MWEKGRNRKLYLVESQQEERKTGKRDQCFQIEGQFLSGEVTVVEWQKPWIAGNLNKKAVR